MSVVELLVAGGPAVAVILLVSLYAGFVVLDRAQKLRRAGAEPRESLERVRASVIRDHLLDAMVEAKEHDTPAARVLAAGLQRARLGPDAVNAALNEAAAVEEERAHRGLSTVATVAHIAPMLGLLGTVTGMIRAFGAFSSGGQPNADELARGISEALIATAAGLVVALLAHVAHGFLNRLVDGALLQVDRVRYLLPGWLVEAQLAGEGGPPAMAAPSRTERRALRVTVTPAASERP